MGVTHGDTGHAIFLTIHRDRSIHYCRAVCRLLCGFRRYRHLCRGKDRIAHIYLYQSHLSSVCGDLPLHGELQIFYFAGTDDSNVCFIRQSLVIDIFCHTADTIAAHLRAAAVCVVHFHFKIRFLRRIDKDHTVTADSEMSVAKLSDDLRLLFR